MRGDLLAAAGAIGAWWLAEISRFGFFAMIAAYGGTSLTLYSLSEVIAGGVEAIIEPLLVEYQADQLAALGD